MNGIVNRVALIEGRQAIDGIWEGEGNSDNTMQPKKKKRYV